MKQKVYHDNTSRARNFDIGDAVYARNYSTGPKWLSGRVQKRTGPVSVLVKLSNGQIWRQHHDQLRSALNCDTPVDSNICTDSPLQEFGPSITEPSPPIVKDTPETEASEASGITASSEQKPSDSPKGYLRRIRKPVDRFEPQLQCILFFKGGDVLVISIPLHIKLLCHFRIVVYLCMFMRMYSQSSHSQSCVHSHLVSCNNILFYLLSRHDTCVMGFVIQQCQEVLRSSQ